MIIRYRDPYELPQEIIIPDGDPSALKEVQDFLNENARIIQNAERRERYHTPYHLEGYDYEDESIAYHDNPEHIVILREERDSLNDALAQLTEIQLRRLLMQADGMTLRQIAEAEGTSVNAVKDSLDGAKRKLLKTL